MTPSFMLALAMSALLLTACWCDLKAFRIPNAIPFAIAGLFVLKLGAAAGLDAWPSHLIAFGMTFAVACTAFAAGWIGGGDAKLIAALALWFGLADLPSFIATTAIGGGLLALVLLGLRHAVAARPATTVGDGHAESRRLLDPKAPVPYALPITAAALLLEWQ